MKKVVLLLTVLLLSGGRMHAAASDSLTVSADSDALVSEINAGFVYQTGEVTLGDGLASLKVPKGYKFLDADQSRYVLTELWGNPPDASTLGMLFPAATDPIGPTSTFAVELSYQEEGYISDEDAADMDYDDLLAEMQNDTEESNEARRAQGYAEVLLVGWAAPPHYDAASKKLHWAKELDFAGQDVHVLNYNIRVLGRRGYLMLNAIGDMGTLPLVQRDVNQILASVAFNQGNRYLDYDPAIDKVAAYGIGGLITGKILAKVGAFAFLAKFWKVIAAGAAGAFMFLRRRFAAKSS